MTTRTDPTNWPTTPDHVALVTGGTLGLGRELVRALLARGDTVVTDARRTEHLDALRDEVAHDAAHHTGRLVTVGGDLTDPAHRQELRETVLGLGRLDLLVNNASTLGVTPMPRLGAQGPDNLRDTLETNLIAPHDLTRTLLPLLRATRGIVVDVTSDAAVEGYEGWGAYGAAKAALEQWSNVLAAEEPDLSVYWVDPGDLRTDLHQAAFPDDDISDRPLPHVAVPGFLALLDRRPPGGRYRLQDLAPPTDDPAPEGLPPDGATDRPLVSTTSATGNAGVA